MATSFISSPLLLPSLTSLIGTGGFTVGIYSFLNPSAAAGIYGIPFTTTTTTTTTLSTLSSTPDLTSFLSPSPSDQISKNQSSTTPAPAPQEHHHHHQYQTSLIHALGIRNLTTGLTILSLSAYWFTLTNTNSTATETMQKVLGLVVLIGGFVPFVDAWVCWGWAGNDRGKQVGRRAGWLHFWRGWVWVGVGVGCFIGV